MSIFDNEQELYEFIKSTPTTIGSVQHFTQLTVGAGESSIILMNSEAAMFGGRSLTDAKAYIKTDGTYKFKDADGNDILTNLGLQVGAISNLLSIQGWTSDLVFSATDNDTVAWTLGTIKLTDGTTFSIVAGNTGNMTALTYIYFDKAVSETVLQITTTAATAVGANKILIAVAQNVASGKDAEFQVFGGAGGIGKLITADNIAAGTITTNEIATNTIVANNMNVSQLSAIAADLGSITAGTITGAIIRTVVPGVATGSGVVMNGGNNEMVRFYYNDTQTATIKGYTTEGSEVTYLDIAATSNRGIKLKNSFIQFNGNLIKTNGNDSIGSSGTPWDWGYFGDVWVDNGYNGDIYVATSDEGACTKKLNIEHGIVYDR